MCCDSLQKAVTMPGKLYNTAYPCHDIQICKTLSWTQRPKYGWGLLGGGLADLAELSGRGTEGDLEPVSHLRHQGACKPASNQAGCKKRKTMKNLSILYFTCPLWWLWVSKSAEERMCSLLPSNYRNAQQVHSKMPWLRAHPVQTPAASRALKRVPRLQPSTML